VNQDRVQTTMSLKNAFNKTQASKYCVVYLKACTGRTKIMPFRVMELLTSKACINNKTLQQINSSTSLGYSMSYAREDDLK
jgi:hypothetical protein